MPAPVRLTADLPPTGGLLVPERSAEDIQHDIERSRATLASSVDQLVYRGNPKRIAYNAKQCVKQKLQTPQGKAVLAVVGGLVVLVVVRRVRKH